MDQDQWKLEQFKVQIGILIGSGERTRAILYFFGVFYSAIFVFGWESDGFDWANDRNKKMSTAYSCYIQRLDRNDPAPIGDKDKNCDYYYKYVEAWYYLKMPDGTKDANYNRNSVAITDKYKLLSKEYVESASTTIPILGVKVEKNDIFVFGMFVYIFALFTLYLSTLNEIKCVHDIRPLIVDRYQKNAVINCHVFAKPRMQSWRFWWFLFVPAIVGTFDLIWNLRFVDVVASLAGPIHALILYSVQTGLTILLFYVSWLCFFAVSSLDHLLIEIDNILDT
jgi:hypothetical protein